MLDIIVQNVHLISSDGREAETWANDKVNNCQVVSEVRPQTVHLSVQLSSTTSEGAILSGSHCLAILDFSEATVQARRRAYR